MKREALEHVLRAASRITKQRDFLVVGTGAILGSYPEERLPYEATRSDEADLAPFDDADGSKSLEIEGSLGQGSRFHQTLGITRTALTPKQPWLRMGGRDASSHSSHQEPPRDEACASNLTTSPLRNWRPDDPRTTSSLEPSWTAVSLTSKFWPTV